MVYPKSPSAHPTAPTAPHDDHDVDVTVPSPDVAEMSDSDGDNHRLHGGHDDITEQLQHEQHGLQEELVVEGEDAAQSAPHDAVLNDNLAVQEQRGHGLRRRCGGWRGGFGRHHDCGFPFRRSDDRHGRPTATNGSDGSAGSVDTTTTNNSNNGNSGGEPGRCRWTRDRCPGKRARRANAVMIAVFALVAYIMWPGTISTNDVKTSLQTGSGIVKFDKNSVMRNPPKNRQEQPRVNVQAVRFNTPFAKAPTVTVAMNHLDSDSRSNVRVTVEAVDVTSKGFTLKVTTWGDTKLYAVGYAYFAVAS